MDPTEGFQPEPWGTPKSHKTVPEDAGATGMCGERPGMLLYILQPPGQPHTATQSTNCAEAEQA